MGMNVGNFYSDPAQLYNDVIYPQNGRKANERDYKRYDNDISKAPKYEDTEKSLSPTAKAFLEEVRKTYADKDMEFVIADSNNSAEAKAKLANGQKGYTILFTKDEIEKMATDRNYCGKMLCQMQMDMHKAQEYNGLYKQNHGIPANVSSGINRVAVSYNSDGSSSIFAEFEKAGQSEKPDTKDHKINHKDRPSHGRRHSRMDDFPHGRHPRTNEPPYGERHPRTNEPPYGRRHSRTDEPPRGRHFDERNYARPETRSEMVEVPQLKPTVTGNATPENPNRWKHVDSKED